MHLVYQQHFSKLVSSPDCDCVSRCIAYKTNNVNILAFQQIMFVVILLTVCLMVEIAINIANIAQYSSGKYHSGKYSTVS